MENSFEFEWWTVSIRFPTGIQKCVYKGKTKETIIKQIEREVKKSNSPENLARPVFDPKRKQQILEVLWDTLTFDRKGYQRLF